MKFAAFKNPTKVSLVETILLFGYEIDYRVVKERGGARVVYTTQD